MESNGPGARRRFSVYRIITYRKNKKPGQIQAHELLSRQVSLVQLCS